MGEKDGLCPPTGHYVSHSASPLLREHREKNLQLQSPFSSLVGVVGMGCSVNGSLRSTTDGVPCPYTEGSIFYACYISGFLSFQTNTPSTLIPEPILTDIEAHAHAARACKWITVVVSLSYNQWFESHVQLLRRKEVLST